jgi:iron uptake system component EfeO
VLARVPFRLPALVATASIAIAVALVGCGGHSSPAGGPATGRVVEVRAAEYSFTPATISVPRGNVTFRLTNRGEAEHEFELFRGETVVDEIEGLVPGLTRDLTLTLEPGSYTYVCKLAAHDTLGMTGTLTVTE